MCSKKERSREGNSRRRASVFACPEIRRKEENQEEKSLQNKDEHWRSTRKFPRTL
jgi:hypothetical protein